MVKFTKAPSRFSKGSTKGSGKSIRASSTTKFKVSVRNTRTGEVKSFTRTVRSKGSKGSSRRRREEELRVKKVALEKKLIEDKARGEAISKSISLVSERKRSKMKETAERKSKRSKLLVQKFKTSKILKALRIGRKVQKKVEVKSIKAAKGMVQLGKGVGEGIKEIITLPFHALKNSFEYGRQLRRRAEAGDDSPLNKDIKKLAIGTVSVASFVKKNPRQAAAIVAAGAAGVGGDINAAFKKDPAFATGKAVAYLFPGTIIKGGVQAAGLGTKGIRSTTQAVNLIRSNKKVSVAVSRGNLASSQLKSVNIAIVKASKVTKGVKQDKILKTALGKVLKQRGIKTRPSASVQTLAKQVAASRDVVKVIEKTKVVRAKKLTPAKLKKVKVEVGTIVKIKAPKKVIKKRAIKFVVDKGKLRQVKTLKELTVTKGKKKIAKPKEEVKTLDITKLEQQRFSKELAEKGVIEVGKTTFIDINAITRITKANKIPVKAVISNKKAQAQFKIQIQKSARVFKTKAKVLKGAKQVNLSDVLKLKQQFKGLIKIIKATKPLRFIVTAALIAQVKGISRDIDIAEAQAKTPAFKKMPAKALKSKQTPIQTPAKAFEPKFDTPAKSKSKSGVRKKPRAPKKPTPKKPVVPKVPKLRFSFDSKLPKGKSLMFDIKFRERKIPNKPAGKTNPVIVKTRILGLPLNKAIKKGFGAIDRTTQVSAQLIISGITSSKDISSGSVKALKSKFGVKRGKTALRFVEKNRARIDTRGEKKGLSISKLIKKKKK